MAGAPWHAATACVVADLLQLRPGRHQLLPPLRILPLHYHTTTGTEHQRPGIVTKLGKESGNKEEPVEIRTRSKYVTVAFCLLLSKCKQELNCNDNRGPQTVSKHVRAQIDHQTITLAIID